METWIPGSARNKPNRKGIEWRNQEIINGLCSSLPPSHIPVYNLTTSPSLRVNPIMSILSYNYPLISGLNRYHQSHILTYIPTNLTVTNLCHSWLTVNPIYGTSQSGVFFGGVLWSFCFKLNTMDWENEVSEGSVV